MLGPLRFAFEQLTHVSRFKLGGMLGQSAPGGGRGQCGHKNSSINCIF
jgi:hypothetical protein